MTGGNVSANYVANYLKPGPESSPRAPIVLTETSKVKFFLKDNIVEGRPQHTSSLDSMFEAKGNKELYTIVQTPFDVPAVKTSTAQQAYHDVLANVGGYWTLYRSEGNTFAPGVPTGISVGSGT